MSRIEALILLIFQAPPEDGLVYAIRGNYLFGRGIENSLRNIVILDLLSNLPQVKLNETLVLPLVMETK